MNQNKGMPGDFPGEDAPTQDMKVSTSTTSESETRPLIDESPRLEARPQADLLYEENLALKAKIEFLETEHARLRDELEKIKYKTSELETDVLDGTKAQILIEISRQGALTAKHLARLIMMELDEVAGPIQELGKQNYIDFPPVDQLEERKCALTEKGRAYLDKHALM